MARYLIQMKRRSFSIIYQAHKYLFIEIRTFDDLVVKNADNSRKDGSQ